MASPAVTIVVLLIVIWRLGTGPLLDGVNAVDGRALGAAVAVVLVTTICAAWRWTIVARGLGVPLSLPAAVAAYYRAVFLNLTLPSGIAGDVYRGVRHGRDVRDVGRGLRAVVWERGAGQAVQAILTIAVLVALPSPVRSSMPLVAAAVSAFALVLLLVARNGRRGRSRWTRSWNAVVTDLRDGVLRRGAISAVVLTSIVIVIGHTVTFVIAARTVGVTTPLSRLLPLAMLAMLVMVIPSVGGWGPREGLTAWVFAAAGVGADRGAAAAVTYGVLVLVASTPGAVVLFAGWLPRRPPVARRRQSATPTPPVRSLPVNPLRASGKHAYQERLGPQVDASLAMRARSRLATRSGPARQPWG